MEPKTLFSRNTPYNADCIDFCQIESFEHFCAIGTYQLVKGENGDYRVGHLHLFSLENQNLVEKQILPMPGILDLRWCPHLMNNKVLLALVNAEGYLITFNLDSNSQLNEMFRIKICSGLALYLDWSNLCIENSNPSIVVSDSLGQINTVSVNNESILLETKLNGHKFEAWTANYNYWNPSIVYSGGDDCLFKGYDIRSNGTQIFCSKEHTAGVTSIQPSLWQEEIMFSGCYNGDFISWDTRRMKQPLSKDNLGGGIWRLRSEPHRKPMLIASLMHNGFLVMDINSTCKNTPVCKYAEHKSLAYGSSWNGKLNEEKHVIGSVSFYDNLFNVWEFG